MKETFVNGVPTPWTPVKANEGNKKCTVEVWGRTYTVDKNLLFSSVVSQGEELLSSPIRIKAGRTVTQLSGKILIAF